MSLCSKTLNCKMVVRRKRCLGDYDILMGNKIGRDKNDGAHTKNEEPSTMPDAFGAAPMPMPVNECYKCC